MRSKAAPTRLALPDPIYKNVLVTKLINRVMLNGKKTVAQSQVYQAFDLLKQQTGQEPLQAFLTALENIKPQLEVKARRVGGAAYQIPIPVRGPRRDSLGIRWLITAAQDRSGSQYHSFAQKLCAEIVDALNNAGGAVKKRTDTHRMAEANKAFAHFRF